MAICQSKVYKLFSAAHHNIHVFILLFKQEEEQRVKDLASSQKQSTSAVSERLQNQSRSRKVKDVYCLGKN